MNIRKFLTPFAALLMIGGTSVAQADLVSSTSDDGNENALTCLFNGASGGSACDDPGWITSGSDVDVNSEAVTSPGWAIGSSTGSFSKIVIEIAGNANINTFGIYDLRNPNNRLQLFDGAATAGDRNVVEYLGDGNYGTGLGYGPSATFASGSKFGFYLGGEDYYFFSDATENPDGSDQMVAYNGGNDRYADFFGSGSAEWMSNEWILAWEDLPYLSSDQDFNDFVILAESVTPVPVPAPLALLGAGLLAVAGFARRRRREA